MFEDLKMRIQTDAKLKTKLKVISIGLGAFLTLYFITESMSDNRPVKKAPVYKVDASIFNADEGSNEFEKDGLYSQINELKDTISKGSSENHNRILQLERELKKKENDQRSLKSELRTAKENSDRELQDKLEIFSKQVEQRIKAISDQTGAQIDLNADLLSSDNTPHNMSYSNISNSGSESSYSKSIEGDYASLMDRYSRNGSQMTPYDQGVAVGTGQVNTSESSVPLDNSLKVRVIQGRGAKHLDSTGLEIVKNSAPVDKPVVVVQRQSTSKTAKLVESSKSEKPKEMNAYIPAGSLIQGILMSGVDAPTDQEAQAEPHPVLVRVKKQAILPNRFRLDIRDCVIIGAAYGKLNTSRAYIRAEKISCIREDGGVIETGLKAYAVGEDGKVGMPGHIISKQGTVIARSILAGTLEGLANAFKPEQVPVIVDTTAGDKLYQKTSAGDVGTIAGYNGAATGLAKASEYYQKIAEDLYPVIEISGGRKIEFILTSGSSLAMR
jgi:conjugal transfer pilus assembly protein TraB